jgi:hypothetical protein
MQVFNLSVPLSLRLPLVCLICILGSSGSQAAKDWNVHVHWREARLWVVHRHGRMGRCSTWVAATGEHGSRGGTQAARHSTWGWWSA